MLKEFLQPREKTLPRAPFGCVTIWDENFKTLLYLKNPSNQLKNSTCSSADSRAVASTCCISRTAVGGGREPAGELALVSGATASHAHPLSASWRRIWSAYAAASEGWGLSGPCARTPGKRDFSLLPLFCIFSPTCV